MSLMIVDYDQYIAQINGALGDLRSETPKVLRSALSATARSVRKKTIKDTKKRYDYQDDDKLLKSSNKGALKIKAGTKEDRFYTKLFSHGPMNELMDFMVRPSDYNPKGRPDAHSSRVLSSGALKILGDKPKPFVVKFKSGHIAIVQRTGEKPLPVKKLLSPSVPSMLNSSGIRETAEKMIAEELPVQVRKAIEKTLRKAAEKQ